VKSTGDLQGRLTDYKPGDTVTLTVWSEGKTRKVRIRLQARNEGDQSPSFLIQR